MGLQKTESGNKDLLESMISQSWNTEYTINLSHELSSAEPKETILDQKKKPTQIALIFNWKTSFNTPVKIQT